VPSESLIAPGPAGPQDARAGGHGSPPPCRLAALRGTPRRCADGRGSGPRPGPFPARGLVLLGRPLGVCVGLHGRGQRERQRIRRGPVTGHPYRRLGGSLAPSRALRRRGRPARLQPAPLGRVRRHRRALRLGAERAALGPLFSAIGLIDPAYRTRSGPGTSRNCRAWPADARCAGLASADRRTIAIRLRRPRDRRSASASFRPAGAASRRRSGRPSGSVRRPGRSPRAAIC
jgi:hypothetical protein